MNAELVKTGNAGQAVPVSMIAAERTIKDVQDALAKLEMAKKELLKEGEDYGKIPNCGDKPSLFQPGAQKLNLLFNFSYQHVTTHTELPSPPFKPGHREYTTTFVWTNASGRVIGTSEGVCSTHEAKYLTRNIAVLTDCPVPKKYWDARKAETEFSVLQDMLASALSAHTGAAVAPKGLGTKKTENGQWVITVTDKGEHDNPADYFNTCSSISFKRGFVQGQRYCTASSHIWTQDIEDNPELYGGIIIETEMKRTTTPANPPVAPETKKSEAEELDPEKKQTAAKPETSELTEYQKACLRAKELGIEIKRQSLNKLLAEIALKEDKAKAKKQTDASLAKPPVYPIAGFEPKGGQPIDNEMFGKMEVAFAEFNISLAELSEGMGVKFDDWDLSVRDELLRHYNLIRKNPALAAHYKIAY